MVTTLSTPAAPAPAPETPRCAACGSLTRHAGTRIPEPLRVVVTYRCPLCGATGTDDSRRDGVIRWTTPRWYVARVHYPRPGRAR